MFSHKSESQSRSSPKDAPEAEVPEITGKQLGKRNRDNYTLDEHFYESNFEWRDGPNKKIKLDTQDNRRDALNARPSFTNLVSSASLILPPEIDTVVITRDKFVVEWNQDQSSEDMLPPTVVHQVIKEEKKESVQNEIHRSSFNMPLYYCNTSTHKDVIDKIREEKRIAVSSQITDTETSLSQRLNARAASIANDAFRTKMDKNKEKTINEKLQRTIKAMNDSLGYFNYIPAENVPIRDKKTVSIVIHCMRRKQ